MPWGWLIAPEEFISWVVYEDEHTIAVNKPAHVITHPSKRGPWSSLVGACREVLELERVHMPSRLDRETSGVVVFAKDHRTASRLQNAIARRRVRKSYAAVLCGEMRTPASAEGPIGADERSVVSTRRAVVAPPLGQAALTHFEPLAWGNGFTLARAIPHTGRMHQIRVHAAALGYPLLGDKLYGPDETFFLDFVRNGFTPRLAAGLEFGRHALHALSIRFPTGCYSAPLAEDLAAFCRSWIGCGDELLRSL